jgi:signal transduction histidine kinase
VNESTAGAGQVQLADEQAALRRVATLVAEGATTARLCAAVLEEVVRVLDVPAAWLLRYDEPRSMTILAAVNDPAFPIGSRWPLDGSSVTSAVHDTGRPARIDDYTGLEGPIAERTRTSGFRSSLGVPILVGGTVWGAVCVGTTEAEPLPPDTEDRLFAFTELVALAISNTEAREHVARLADEQAALLRVATLVARGGSPAEVFDAVSEEVGGLLGLRRIETARFASDRTATVIGTTRDHAFPVGTSWTVDGPSVIETVLRTGEPARIDDYSALPGTVAEARRQAGIVSAIGAPIVVDGAVWGAILAVSETAEPIPEGAEARLGLFTELIATAVANVQAHDDLRGLASEQASLRRVATLVAEGASTEELFAGVATEVRELLDVPAALIDRYEPDGTAVNLAASHDPDWTAADAVVRPGLSWPLDVGSMHAIVYDTGRSARLDDYSGLEGVIGDRARAAGFGTGCAAPITVDGRLWGLIRVYSREGEELPPDAEVRLQGFTDLVAAAISNAQAHDDLHEIATEQAALRRVATLVAEGIDSAAVFDAVCAETGQLFGAASVNLSHYTADGFNVTMAGWSLLDRHVPVGTRLPITPDTVGGAIVETRAPARVDSWDEATSEMAAVIRGRGLRSSLGAPIVVEGQLWGALVAATDGKDPLPAGTEHRLARFTDLVATAISNAATRSELIASRARIVSAGDEARRRIERNLHDGTQQRLIALGLDLQRVQESLPAELYDARAGLDGVERDLDSVLEDLRELSRGLHPPLLARRGLRMSLRALTRGSPVPVDLDIDLPERPPPSLETALYYIVAEALTNAIKHSHANAISVTITADHTGGPFGIRLDGRAPMVKLHATIADDGVGGAEPSAGSGLIGLSDRVDALGGRFSFDSPPGRGTRIAVEFPLETATGV